jgi:hypothetical protein
MRLTSLSKRSGGLLAISATLPTDWVAGKTLFVRNSPAEILNPANGIFQRAKFFGESLRRGPFVEVVKSTDPS